MRNTRWMGLAAVVCAAGLAGCGKKDEGPSYAFVTNGVASFWDIAKSGAEAAGQELGVDVTVLMPNGVVEQKQMIEDLVIRGADGIAISPIDPDNQTEVINEAAAATNLITADSDAPKSDRMFYLGVDNYEAGRMCGQLVKEALPDGGKVMIFIGRLEQDNAKRRRQGVIDELLDRSMDPTRFDPPAEVLKNDKYEILGTLTDQFDRVRGKQNMDDTLTAHPDLGCAVGLFVFNPPLILESLKSAGKLGQVKVVGFDEADETLQGILDGHVHGTVVQNPFEYGKRSIEILHALNQGDTSVVPEDGFINVPARQIRKDTAEAFWADLKSKLGE
ncbi:sugar-binding protein [Haloferula rosea]|uniref:Sugar-binding protein n=1 Tax=Haloferula rosea TaxID=490093 RepID=A0A934RB33_9BACT|nr:sugar-binding protein [Haloferula rosea]MBK1825716.1 sugar-binding protein [Haloferula rosea]